MVVLSLTRRVLSVVFMGTVFLSACSSSRTQEEDFQLLPPEESAEWVGSLDNSPLNASVLNFYASKPSYGVVLTDFNWSAPLTSTNPGMDCTLKLRMVGPPLNVFTCRVMHGEEAPVIVTVFENMQGSVRRLARVVVDTKGVEHRADWEKNLREAGYQRRGTSLVSADRRTSARFVWIPAQNALSLVFSPIRRH